MDILGVHRGRRWSGSLFPLTPEYIAAGDVWITTGTDGQIAGFVGAGTPRCSGTLDLNKLVHRSGGGTAVRCSRRSDEERQRGAERLTILAGPERNALLRAQRRGADRRVALGRRCPAACSRGVTLTSGVTVSADPNINRRSGGSASWQIPRSSCAECAETRFTSQLKWRASAGFPDQANKFPDGPIQFPARPR